MIDDIELTRSCGAMMSLRHIRFGIDRHPETGHQSGRCEAADFIAPMLDDDIPLTELITLAAVDPHDTFIHTGDCEAEGVYLVIISDDWSRRMNQITGEGGGGLGDDVDEYWYCEQHAQSHCEAFMETHEKCED